MAAYGGADRALLVYICDDGSATDRLHVVRVKDPAENPGKPEFHNPVIQDGNTGNVIDAKIRLDQFGDGLLVWTQMEGSLARLFASYYTHLTDSFSPAQKIDYTPTGENLSADGVLSFDFELDAAGNGIIGFFENTDPAEAYGVYYDHSDHVFLPPENVGYYPGQSGRAITKVQVAAGTEGVGFIGLLQDTDPGPADKECCAGSKFSSESSLSAFSAPIRVNPDTPPFDNGVRDFSVSALPNGDLLFLMEQNNASGRSIIRAHRWSASQGGFEPANPTEITAPDTTHDFVDPLLLVDGSGNAMALFLRTDPATPGLFYNYYDANNEAFSTAGPVRVSDPGNGGEVLPGFLGSFDANGNAEVAFLQALVDPAGPCTQVWSTRFSGSTKVFGSSRRIDPGLIETSEVAGTLPLTFSDPEVTGVGFDNVGRAFISFTLSDGRLHRLYVNRTELGDPTKFEGARPVDGANRNSVFSQTANVLTDEAEPGEGRFYVNPKDGTGFAVMPQRKIIGATVNTVRLWGNTYHGFNTPEKSSLLAAQMTDAFPEGPSALNVGDYALGMGADGTGLTVFVQSDGTTQEIYARSFDPAGGAASGLLGTFDNTTNNTPKSPAVLLDGQGEGFILFLQNTVDSGGGIDQLYARRFSSTGVANIGTTATPGYNEPLGMTDVTYGPVTSYAWALDSAGRACVALRQAKPGGEWGIFVLRIDTSGQVDGPREITSPSLTQVSNAALAVSSDDRVLVVYSEGTVATLRSTYFPDSSQFAAFGSGQSADVESLAPSVGNFDLAGCAGAFLVAFVQDDGGGAAIWGRRFRAGTAAWDGSAAHRVSPAATASAVYGSPHVVLDDAGNGLVVFSEQRSAPTSTVNLLGSAFDPTWVDGTTTPPSPFTTSLVIDADDSTAGYPVQGSLVAVNPATGRGVVAIHQEGDGALNRLYTRGFDLSGTGNLFEGSAMDRNEGGAVISTDVIGYQIAIDRSGFGVLLHAEREVSINPDDTRIFLFARAYDESAGFFGPAHLACRMLHRGSGPNPGDTDAEGCTSPALAQDGAGNFKVVHKIGQNHQTNGQSERLFSTGLRVR
jgi:hypothetical protein